MFPVDRGLESFASTSFEERSGQGFEGGRRQVSVFLLLTGFGHVSELGVGIVDALEEGKIFAHYSTFLRAQI